MKIEWNNVTWYSWVVAIIVFVGVFALGIWLGTQIEIKKMGDMPGMGQNPMGQMGMASSSDKILATVTYSCDAGKKIQAIYKDGKVEISTNDGKEAILPQVISADGGRYANSDESLVFWSKGNGAFVTQTVNGVSTTTYSNCTQIPAPVSP